VYILKLIYRVGQPFFAQGHPLTLIRDFIFFGTDFKQIFIFLNLVSVCQVDSRQLEHFGIFIYFGYFCLSLLALTWALLAGPDGGQN
jgi:hypothetical protein